MAESGKLGEVFGEMMRGASSPFQNARVLQTFLHAIDELDCDNTENLGDAYEHLLSIMGTQGDAGQFRTPRHIIDFIVAAVAPQKNERVLDPACGSAGFWSPAHAHVMRHGGTLSPADKRKLAQNIVGRDIDPGMARLAMVNLYLHKIKSPQVREYDSLSDDSLWEERADVILANPPFMTPRGGIQPHGRFMVRANRAEVLFVDYIAEHLSPQGRAGVIVPEGIIFQSGKAYKDLRKMLVEDWGLWAVASLPTGVFQPYSGVKTSVLFLDKTRRHFKNVLFVKVQNDGFDLGAKRNPIDEDDLPAALQILRNYTDKDAVNSPLASVFAKTKIAEGGDYSFSADNYREVAVVNCKYPTMLVGEAIQPIKQRSGIPKSKWKANGKYPVIDQSMNFIAGYWDNPDDVIRVSTPMIAFGLHTRRLKYVDFDFVLGAQGVKLLLPKPEFNPAFFYFACKNLDIKDLGYAIHWKELKKLSIPCPPLAEQERVVAEIAGYAKVRDGADTVVQNWRPNVKINPAWSLVKLGELVIDMKDGGTPPRKDKKNFGGEINWAVVKDICHEIRATKETLSEQGLKNCSAKVWPVDSVIISLGATIGNVGIAKIPVATKQGLSGIVVNKEKILVDYLYYILRQKRDFIKSLATGVSIVEIRPSKLKEKLHIPLPPLAEQERIVAEVEAERRAVEECRALSATMEQKITNTIARIWEDKP